MKRLLQIAAIVCGILVGLVFLQVISNSNHIASVSTFLRAWSLRQAAMDPAVDYNLLKEAYERINLYNTRIEEDHLDEGMVVNRKLSGAESGKCDSLLFSALRFSALSKLNMPQEAKTAWESIEHSQYGGHWYRHPKCRHKNTSRDMIVGLLVALSQKPEHYRIHFKSFLTFVSHNKGYFSNGPVYLSYLSPAMSEIVRNMARSLKMPYSSLPPSVRASYSTVELDAILAKPGYTSHLIALLTWLEFELTEKYENFQVRTLVRELGDITNPFTLQPLQEQRLEYVTQRLVEVDPSNLFFKYLRYRAAGALNTEIRRELLATLVSMKEFPRNDLPKDCNRRADYLWQRDSRSYKKGKPNCNVTYSGVDFIWMASLLLEDQPVPNGLAPNENVAH